MAKSKRAKRGTPRWLSCCYYDQLLRRNERQVLIQALRRAGGNITEAAQSLGISRARMYRRLDLLEVYQW